MTHENLTLTKDGPVATLTIDRPKALNALNTDTLRELADALDAVASDDAVRVLIVTGAGDKAFVAGADIRTMADMGPLDAEAHAAQGLAVCQRLEDMPKVTIAAVNGYALGGGLELALACDLRVASENAVLGLPETSLSVIPGFGGTQRLPRLIGPAKAKELIFTSRKVPAQEAERLGLVNRVVSQEKLMDACRELADEVLANGPVAVRLAKEVIDAGLQTDLDRALELEKKAFGLVFSTKDQKEGMKAFLEKRKPQWQGE